MASVSTESSVDSAIERNESASDEYYYNNNDNYDSYDNYYYYDDEAGNGDVHWPYVLFDVLLAVAVVVDLLLILVVLSGRTLRRGPPAVFIISLAAFDFLHLVSIRVGVYVLAQFEMHPAAHLICKVHSASTSRQLGGVKMKFHGSVFPATSSRGCR